MYKRQEGMTVTGWQWIDGKCYYFDNLSAENFGQMHTEGRTPVSYTHLDVYKRQPLNCITIGYSGSFEAVSFMRMRIVSTVAEVLLS